MCALPQTNYTMTEEEYLAFERKSQFKHEYVDGEVYAMAGASANHVDIASTLFGLMFSQFRNSSCTVHNPDMRLKVLATGNYFYPDVSAVCGERDFAPDEAIATLLNPTLLVEVLSSSTELYDRSTKLFQYQTIPSLQDLLLVSQNQPRIEHYSRHQDSKWIYSAHVGLEGRIELSSISYILQLADVYQNITFPETDEGETEA